MRGMKAGISHHSHFQDKHLKIHYDQNKADKVTSKFSKSRWLVFHFVLVPACKAKIPRDNIKVHAQGRINPLFIYCKAFGYNEVRGMENGKLLTCPEDGGYFMECSAKFSAIYKIREKIPGLWEKETSYPEDRRSPTVTPTSSWVNPSRLTSVQACTWAGDTRHLLLTPAKLFPSPL